MSKTLCSRDCIGPFAILLEFLSLADGVEIFFHATGEDELHIGLRFVIDQEVQFAAVKPRFGKFVLHGDAVDGKSATVGEDSFYAVGIKIKSAMMEMHCQSSLYSAGL